MPSFHRVKDGIIELVNVLNPCTLLVRCSECVGLTGGNSRNFPEYACPRPFSCDDYPHKNQQVYVWHEDVFLRGVVRDVNIILNLCLVHLVDDYQLLSCAPDVIYPLRGSSPFSADNAHCHLVGLYDALCCSPSLLEQRNETVIKETLSTWKSKRTKIANFMSNVKLINFEAICEVEGVIYGKIVLILFRQLKCELLEFLSDEGLNFSSDDFRSDITKIKNYNLLGSFHCFVNGSALETDTDDSSPDPLDSEASYPFEDSSFGVKRDKGDGTFFIFENPPLNVDIGRSQLEHIKGPDNIVALKRVFRFTTGDLNRRADDCICQEKLQEASRGPKSPSPSPPPHPVQEEVQTEESYFNFLDSLKSLKERGGDFIGDFNFEEVFIKHKRSFEHLNSSFKDLGISELNDMQVLSFPGLLLKKDFVLIAEPQRNKTVTILLALFTVLCLQDSKIIKKAESYLLENNMKRSPKCIIFVPGWERGQALMKKLICFSPTFLVCEIYGYLMHEELKDVLQKCDILVTTPLCWLRLINELKLLSKGLVLHMIFDTCEDLAQRFPYELLDIFNDEFCEFTSSAGVQKKIRIQKVVSCSQFNCRVLEFIDILHTPLYCVDDAVNLLALAGLGPNLIYRTEPKIHLTIDLPEQISKVNKVVIFCDDAEQAAGINVSPERRTFIAHERLRSEELNGVLSSWGEANDSYLICSDKIIMNEIYSDSVVHLTWPASQEVLARRLNVLRKVTEEILGNSVDSCDIPDGVHFLIITKPETYDKLKFICRFEYGESLDPKSFVAPESPAKSICSDILDYGFCNDRRKCESRHSFISDDQTPVISRVRYIKFRVSEVISVNRFKVQVFFTNSDYRCRNEFWIKDQEKGRVFEVIVADLIPEDLDTSWNPRYSKAIKCCFTEIEKASLQCFGKVLLALEPSLYILQDIKFYVTTSSNVAVAVGSYGPDMCVNRFCDINSIHSSELTDKCNSAGLRHYFIDHRIGSFVELEDGISEDCYASVSESPSSFFVLLKKNMKSLQDFKKFMGNWIQEKIITPKSIVASGDICLVASPEGSWERGIVTKVINDTAAQVFFLDSGHEFDCDVNDIYEVPEEFILKLPFQAVHCELDGIIPLDIESGWSDLSKSELNAMLFEKDGTAVELTITRTSCDPVTIEKTGAPKMKAVVLARGKSISHMLFRKLLANVTDREFHVQA